MKNKRIILDITGELHSKLKQYAVKDERTLSTVLRKILLAGVNTLSIEKDVLMYNVDNSDKPVSEMTDEEREIRVSREF